MNSKFDVLVVSDIIEHLSNPGLMLEGIKRFCDQNSIIIITTPHSFGLMNYLRFIFGKFHEGTEHVITFNIPNLINLLKKHGFHVETIDMCYQNHSYKKKLFKIGKLFFKRFPKFGGTIFVVATFGKHE